MKLVAALLCALCVCHAVLGQGIGFKTTLTQAGLNYLDTVGMQILQQSLGSISIPDMSGDDGTAIGHVSWQLTNIVLTGTQVSSSSITPLAGTGISINLANLAATVNLDWHYRKDHWPHVSDHGTATVTMSGTSSQISMSVVDVGGRPQVKVLSDSLSVGSLDIKLHGGASWLYNFFISVLHDKIKKSIENSLQTAIATNVNNGVNQALSTLQISAIVGHLSEINYELSANPTFTSSYITLNQLGEFYAVSNPQECPNPPCSFSSIPDSATGDEVQMIVSDFVANSAGFAYYKMGKLQTIVTDAEVPSYSPIRLNTTYFKYIIPPLYQRYPNNLLQVNVYATQAPQASFTSSGCTISAVGNMEVDVIANGTAVNAFTLSGVANLAGAAILSNNMVIGNLSFVTTNFSLSATNIGPFDATTLDTLMNLFFAQGIVPEINQELAQGIPLPVIQGLTLINPTLIWGERYLVVSSNIHYVPTAPKGDKNIVPIRIE